jgi:hypothetical protein
MADTALSGAGVAHRGRSHSGRSRSGRRLGAPPSLIAAAIPSALGVLLLVLGWISVSGEASFSDQQTGLNLAIVGAIVVLAGCGFYLYMFRRRIARRVAVVRATTFGEEED